MEHILKKQLKKKGFDYSWPKIYLDRIVCPLCNTKQFKKLYPNHYLRIVQCANCNLIYTNPRLKEKYLKKLYSEEYFQNEHSSLMGYDNYVQDEENIKKTFHRRLSHIEKHIKPGKLLDVGCATGFFMKAAQERKWDVEGIEISDYAADYAQKQFGFTVYKKDIHTVKLPKEQYDLITLWDVIEHVPDPIKTLQRAYRLLKKNGILALTTPDAGSIPAKLTKHKWIGYKLSDEHITYFSKQTINDLLKKSGFQQADFSHTGKYVNYSLFANRVGLYNKSLGTMLNPLGTLLKNPSFYISSFDIMCVYAKKA